jgi:hypothetical protein
VFALVFLWIEKESIEEEDTSLPVRSEMGNLPEIRRQ